jgi:D-alanyl-D-alanine carboxypeptidase
MTDLRVLQEGQMRRTAREARARRLRRRHRLRRTAAMLLLVAIVLLGLLAAGIGSPGPSPRSRAGHARAATARAATAPAGSATAHRPAAHAYGRVPNAVQVDPRLKLPLRSGLLFDVRTGRVLWQRNPDRSLPIASLTKMMTALVVLAHSAPTEKVMITRAATRFSGSGVGLLPAGKRVSERALLYGLLLPSGNDAAIALAQHVSGTEQNFIRLMNQRARAMHLACTHFDTVSGVTDGGNHSCATDLAVIAHAVLMQPLLRTVVASRSAVLRFPIKGGKLFLDNNNPLLVDGYPGADGVKTGFTTAAGLCLVAAARRGSTWLAVVLLHSGNWATQATALLDAGFAATRRRSARTAHHRAPPRST